MITVNVNKKNDGDVTNFITSISRAMLAQKMESTTAISSGAAIIYLMEWENKATGAVRVMNKYELVETYAAVEAALTDDEAQAGAQLISNLVTSISGASTDSQYPSAKLLYDQLLLKANAANAALTGIPTAPTAAPGTNTTQLSTTEFVQAAITALIAAAPGALDTLNELAAALGNDANFATTMTNALAAKAPLADPTFTGTPDAPTASRLTETTQIATTEYVRQQQKRLSLTFTNGVAVLDINNMTAAEVAAIAATSKVAVLNMTAMNGSTAQGVYITTVVVVATSITVTWVEADGTTAETDNDATYDVIVHF